MTISPEYVLSISFTFFLIWTGFLVWALKYFIDRAQLHIDHHFKHLDESLKTTGDHGMRLERELLQLKASLPHQYVLKEDWLKFSQQIDMKLDWINEGLTHNKGRTNHD